MNKHVKLLHRLSKIIDLYEYFYVITIYSYKLQLQGHKNDELFALLDTKGFSLCTDDDFDTFTKGEIEIILT